MELEKLRTYVTSLLKDTNLTETDLLHIKAVIEKRAMAHLEKQYPDATIMTLSEFCEECADGNLTPYDENIYFYDGTSQTDKNVWDESWTQLEINNFNYVICHDKKGDDDGKD